MKARDAAFAAYSEAEDKVDATEASVYTALAPLEAGSSWGAVKAEA